METPFPFGKHRIWFIIIPVIITLIMLIPLRQARISTDLMRYLPDDIPAKVQMEALDAEFGKFEPIVLVMESDDVLKETSLARQLKISESLSRSVVFEDVISLFTSKYVRGEAGNMMVDPVVKELPTDAGARELLRNQIIDNPLVFNLLVSEDFKYSMLVLNPAAGYSDKQVFHEIDSILTQCPGPEPILINGLPYLRDEIQKIAIRDLAVLMPLGILIMMLLLWVSFREWKGVLLPLMVVTMSIAIAMGLMPLMGWDLSLIAVLVPIMMIAIANNYGVHLVTRYQELNSRQSSWSMQHIVHEAYDRLKMPILLTALTTIVGILGMATHIMLPARQMGIVSAIGVSFALLVSLWMIPAIMVGMKKGRPHKSFNGEKKGWIDKALVVAGRWSTLYPRRVVWAFTLTILIMASGIIWLRVSFNLERMMPASHPINRSTSIANEHFGGTKRLTLLFEGDVMDPALMKEMDNIASRLEGVPEVGDVSSIAKVIRLISRALNDPGDSLYDRIPGSRDIIAQYIEFYNFSGDPEDFEKLVDFNYSKAVMSIQFKAANIKEFRKVNKVIEEEVRKSSFCTQMAGQCLVEKEMSEAIIRGQIYSLLFAFAAIFLLMMLIFRSPAAGVIGCIPLLASLACNFGLMGFLGLELDIATSLLSSIAIGIGVDYTIHFFWRFRYELSLGKSRAEAARHSVSTTGRGISINAVSVMVGFAVLFFSGLTILKTFAFLIIFSLLLCLLCALLLIPAILIINPNLFNPVVDENKTIISVDVD